MTPTVNATLLGQMGAQGAGLYAMGPGVFAGDPSVDDGPALMMSIPAPLPDSGIRPANIKLFGVDVPESFAPKTPVEAFLASGAWLAMSGAGVSGAGAEPPSSPPPAGGGDGGDGSGGRQYKIGMRFDKKTGALTLTVDGDVVRSYEELVKKVGEGKASEIAGAIAGHLSGSLPSDLASLSAGQLIDALLDIRVAEAGSAPVADPASPAVPPAADPPPRSLAERFHDAGAIPISMASNPLQLCPRLGRTREELSADVERNIREKAPSLIEQLIPEGQSPEDFLREGSKQQFRNFLRLASLFDAYARCLLVATPADRAAIVSEIAASMKDIGIIPLLMRCGGDSEFDRACLALAQQTEMTTYQFQNGIVSVGGASVEMQKARDLLERFYSPFAAFMIGSGIMGRQYWRKFLGHLISGRPSADGERLFHLYEGRDSAAFFSQMALWQRIRASRNWGEVVECLNTLLDYFKPFYGLHLSGEIDREGIERMKAGLMGVKGKGPAKESSSIWPFSGNTSKADDIYDAAVVLAGSLRLVQHSADPVAKLEGFIRAFDAFGKVEGCVDNPIGSVGYHLREIKRHAGYKKERVNTAMAEGNMGDIQIHLRGALFAANQQAVPAGYYIHVRSLTMGETFDDGVVAGPVVASRFITHDNGDVTRQIFVDAGEGPFAYDRMQTESVRLIVDHFEDGSFVGRTEDILDWTTHFSPVFIRDARDEADKMGLPVERVLSWVADHEAQHNVDNRKKLQARRRAMRTPLAPRLPFPVIGEAAVRRLVGMLQQYCTGHTSSELADILAAPGGLQCTVNETGAMIREAIADPEVFRRFRSDPDHQAMPYSAIFEMLEAMHRKRAGRYASDADTYRAIYSEIFGRSIGDLNTQEFVLPRFGEGIFDAVTRALRGD